MPVFLQSLLGGVLIGASAGGLLLVNGRIAGISGILGEATAGRPGPWRWAFLAGLVATGLVASLAGLAPPPGLTSQGLGVLLVSGLLVGFGTSVGSGCTSGHGVCGLANLSPRSLVATATFMVVAAAVVFTVRHVGPVRELMGWTRR
jgi:uncharacterized membrane protein YedE/YeeE